tara:strand:- start:9559 stop:10812 length:1254 start_codon:yes stop_codon:yes gene_type:complete
VSDPMFDLLLLILMSCRSKTDTKRYGTELENSDSVVPENNPDESKKKSFSFKAAIGELDDEIVERKVNEIPEIDQPEYFRGLDTKQKEKINKIILNLAENEDVRSSCLGLYFLNYAVGIGDFGLFEKLVQKGIDITMVNPEDGNSFIQLLASSRYEIVPKIFKMVISTVEDDEKELLMNWEAKDGTTLLHSVANNPDEVISTKIVEELFRGIDNNKRLSYLMKSNQNVFPPFFIAINKSHSKLLTAMLDGLGVENRKKLLKLKVLDRNALHMAVMSSDRIEIYKKIEEELFRGIDSSYIRKYKMMEDGVGHNLLLLAASNVVFKDWSLVKSVLEGMENESDYIMKVSKNGCNVLHIIARCDKDMTQALISEIFEMLKDKDKIKSMKEQKEIFDEKQTPYDIAVQLKRSEEIIDLLKP